MGRVAGAEPRVVEPCPIDDIFITSIGHIENLGEFARFTLCAPEVARDGRQLWLVKAKLIIPCGKVVPMCREAIASVGPFARNMLAH